MSRRLIACTGIVAFAAGWELLSRLGAVPPGSLPPLSTVLGDLAGLAGTGTFWTALAATLRTWAIGLALASAAGIVAGLVIGLIPRLREITHSTVEFLRPIPSVALIPLAVLIFGTGFESGALLVVYAAFWQVLLQVLYGVQDVDPVAIETTRAYRLGWADRLRHLVWPTVLPYVLTGLRLASAVALVLAITAELVIGTPGIGVGIADARSGGNATRMYALVLVAGLLGVLVNVGARAVERRVLWWHASVRRDTVGGAR